MANCQLELPPETHQRSLDVHFDLEGIILIVEVKIAVWSSPGNCSVSFPDLSIID